jgi:hypothetical protein
VSASLAYAALLTILVNVPFGWWREGSRKFSPTWFVAIHAAVPLVIVIRRLLGVRLAWTTLPFLVASYFLGQTLGARARRGWTSQARTAYNSTAD